jgi:DNA invertase Pin-like site-specific DNA recombinase
MAQRKNPVVESEAAERPPRRVGYARVSTTEQDLFMQVEALKKDGCYPIFPEKVSAVSSKRHQWALLRKFVERGDTVVVWSMSRMGRNVAHLLQLEKELSLEGVAIHSLTEPMFDTSTAHGRLMFTVKAAFDQFEREVTQERTRSGLRARQEAGHKLGREREVSKEMVKAMRADLAQPHHTVKTVAKKHGVSVATIYAYIPGGKSGLKLKR